MKKDFDVRYVEEPEPPTLEEKMDNYMESGLLLRICFGPPTSHLIFQGIRGVICAVIIMWLLKKLLHLLALASDMMV